jgi:hypothetical protein
MYEVAGDVTATNTATTAIAAIATATVATTNNCRGGVG